MIADSDKKPDNCNSTIWFGNTYTRSLNLNSVIVEIMKEAEELKSEPVEVELEAPCEEGHCDYSGDNIIEHSGTIEKAPNYICDTATTYKLLDQALNVPVYFQSDEAQKYLGENVKITVKSSMKKEDIFSNLNEYLFTILDISSTDDSCQDGDCK